MAKRKQRTSLAKQQRQGLPNLELLTSAGPMSRPVTRPHRPLQKEFLACALLIAVTFGVYSRALKNPFVNYDDQGYVTENLHVQQGLSPSTLRWAVTATDADNWHPLTWISHALDCELYGLEPSGHHRTSVVLHVLNAGILFLLLAVVTGKRWRSLAVAALFAIHPINVESVAWVAERKNVLSMFFLLTTLAAYGWCARRPNVGRYVVTLVLFALGLASKPMIVTLPFALLLLDFWPLRRVSSAAPASAFPLPQYSLGRLVVEKIPLMILSAASAYLTVIAQRGAIAPNQSLPIAARILNSIYAYAAYLEKAIWPVHLASFYPYEGLRMGRWLFLSSVVVLAGVSYWVWRERQRVYPVVCWLWFLGTVVPMIGFIQVGNQAMADRYAYLPLIGIFVMLVWSVTDFAEERRIALRPIAVAACVVLVMFSLLTWRQIGFWSSSYDLWSHALQVTKDNYMAEDYVGSAILVQNYQATGQRASDEALVHFQNAVRINPEDPISHLNLGADLHEHGKLREAVTQYETVLSLTQDSHLVIKAKIDLGAAHHQLGEFAIARQYYRDVLQVEPHNQIVFTNLGKLGMDERIQQLAASASSHPSPQAYLQLGQLQQAASHLPEARASFETALKINPNFSDAKTALDQLASTVSR